jgi:hypothetical protein
VLEKTSSEVRRNTTAPVSPTFLGRGLCESANLKVFSTNVSHHVLSLLGFQIEILSRNQRHDPFRKSPWVQLLKKSFESVRFQRHVPFLCDTTFPKFEIRQISETKETNKRDEQKRRTKETNNRNKRDEQKRRTKETNNQNKRDEQKRRTKETNKRDQRTKMCYSFRTSLVSYSLGMAAGLFAVLTKQYILGMLILCYVQIQLSEAIIWRALDTNNPALNRIGTSYGQYLLATHNIAIGLGVLLDTLWRDDKKRLLMPNDFIPFGIGILFFFGVLGLYHSCVYENATFPGDRSCTDRSCQNNDNRLQWPFPHDWYRWSFIISLALMAVYCHPMASKIFVGGLFTLTYLLSKMTYSRSVSSVWCFVSAILAPIIVLVNYAILLWSGK